MAMLLVRHSHVIYEVTYTLNRDSHPKKYGINFADAADVIEDGHDKEIPIPFVRRLKIQ